MKTICTPRTIQGAPKNFTPHAVLSDTTNRIFTFYQNFNFLIYLFTLHRFWANDNYFCFKPVVYRQLVKLVMDVLWNVKIRWVVALNTA